jgi:hypothetical protein
MPKVTQGLALCHRWPWGVEGHRAQQGIHVPNPCPCWHASAAGDVGLLCRASQHTEQDGQAHQVVHQERIPGAPATPFLDSLNLRLKMTLIAGLSVDMFGRALWRGVTAEQPQHDDEGRESARPQHANVLAHNLTYRGTASGCSGYVARLGVVNLLPRNTPVILLYRWMALWLIVDNLSRQSMVSSLSWRIIYLFSWSLRFKAC